jgi:hypothetical protein
MKPQYTKPQARDLGGYRSMLASGQWDGPPMPGGAGPAGGGGGDVLNYCYDGSTANTQADCTGGAAFIANTNPFVCSNGSVADGGNCAPGGQPATQGCAEGTSASYWGCTEGSRASTICVPGTQIR